MKDPDSVMKVLLERRSVRKYTGDSVKEEDLRQILEAGRWAPSGLNNQPWRFMVIRDPEKRSRMAELTKYSRIVNECDLCIAVFLNEESGYNRDRDLMGIGACIQNMLLAVHSLGLGAVWLGQIINRKDELVSCLNSPPGNEPVAVIAIGVPGEKPEKSRKEIDDLML